MAPTIWSIETLKEYRNDNSIALYRRFEISDLSIFVNLVILNCIGCQYITNVEKLTNLTTLICYDCHNIINVEKLTNLTTLICYNCQTVTKKN